VEQVPFRGWASSSLRDSHSLPNCVAWAVVFSRHCTPRCTRASCFGGVAPRGERSAGGLQKEKMSLLTLMSQRARSSLGGLVNRGSESWIGMSLHLIAAASGDCGLSAGEEASFVVLSGGNLVRVDTATMSSCWIRSSSWSSAGLSYKSCCRTLLTRNRVAQTIYCRRFRGLSPT